MVKQSCPILRLPLPCGREVLPTHPNAVAAPAIQCSSCRVPDHCGRAPHRGRVREQDLVCLPQQRRQQRVE